MNSADTSAKLQEYLNSLGVNFPSDIDLELLILAFTHKSYAADFSTKVPHNERLEFLGDSILGQHISKLLYRDYPHAAESQLTLSKIYLVKEQTLAEVARNIGLGGHILLGRGEDSQGGRNKDSVLSDTLEALIAYLYLDLGQDIAEWFIDKYIYSLLDKLPTEPGKSAKSLLQEYVQKLHKEVPTYNESELEIDENGQVVKYQSIVYILNEEKGVGVGSNKKKAQEDAASKALEKIESGT